MSTQNGTSIVVTGRGVVSCLGLDVAEMTARVLAGACGIREIPERTAGLRFGLGAPVVDFVPEDHFDGRSARMLDRFTQFATVAGRAAWREADGATSGLDPTRVGVVLGTASSGIDILADGFERIFVGNGRPSPLTIPMTMGNAAASQVAREIGARGPVFGITGACASAAQAIVVGLMTIRAGIADAMVVGGVDSIFNANYLRAWDSMRIVSPDGCRPFSIGRNGLVLGEGAGILLLEREDLALARGARSFGRCLGGATVCDAGDLLSPDPEGMVLALTRALDDAGVTAADVQYVNAHGTGTHANDLAEATAVRRVFGDNPTPISISSTKSQIGHAMGASGGLEAVVTLAALEAGIVPPTLGFLGVDPEIGLEPTPLEPVARELRVAVSNSFGFGGLDTSLVFARA